MGFGKHPINTVNNSFYGPISNLFIHEDICPEYSLFKGVADDFEAMMQVIQCRFRYFPLGFSARQLPNRL